MATRDDRTLEAICSEVARAAREIVKFGCNVGYEHGHSGSRVSFKFEFSFHGEVIGHLVNVPTEELLRGHDRVAAMIAGQARHHITNKLCESLEEKRTEHNRMFEREPRNTTGRYDYPRGGIVGGHADLHDVIEAGGPAYLHDTRLASPLWRHNNIGARVETMRGAADQTINIDFPHAHSESSDTIRRAISAQFGDESADLPVIIEESAEEPLRAAESEAGGAGTKYNAWQAHLEESWKNKSE